MPKINISSKFIVAFALLLAMTATMGTVAVIKMGEVHAITAELKDRWLPASHTLGDLHAYVSQYRIKQGDLVAAPSERTEKLVRNAGRVIDGLVDDLAKTAAGPEQTQAVEAIRTGWNGYRAQSDSLAGMARAGNPEAKALFEGPALDGFYGLEDQILQLVELESKGSDAVSARSAQIYAEARTFMIVTAVLAVAVAVTLLVLLMLNIARPINRMSEAVSRLVAGDLAVEIPALHRGDELGNLARALEQFKALFEADHERARTEAERARQTQATIDAIGGGLAALADGNLTHRVPENGQGALAKLHVDYNSAVESLAAVLGKIVEGCTTIKLGTHEIAAAAHDLSQRSETQATSLAETARTLAEFTGTVKITADNVRQTSSRLAVARETAGTVEEIARRAVEAMRSIEVSSREMAEIVNVIDGIAFQTNLLALNAGVEAARAGESGKGFAVVANEVRALAQRSADAAKDIKALIGTSSEQVGGGVSLVESSGDALRQIVGEVSAVAGLVDEIASAAERQANGIDEISGMVASMDQFTQQNAAMVEQTSAGTRNLSLETEALVAQLGRFALTGNRSGAARPSTPARAVARVPAAAAKASPLPARAAAARPVPTAAETAPVAAETAAPAPASPAPAFHGNAALRVEEDDWSEF